MLEDLITKVLFLDLYCTCFYDIITFCHSCYFLQLNEHFYCIRRNCKYLLRSYSFVKVYKRVLTALFIQILFILTFHIERIFIQYFIISFLDLSSLETKFHVFTLLIPYVFSFFFLFPIFLVSIMYFILQSTEKF